MHSKKLKSVLEGNSTRKRKGRATQPLPTPSVPTPSVPTPSVPTPSVPTQPPPPRNFFDVVKYLYKGKMTPNEAGTLGKQWGTNLRKYGRISPPKPTPPPKIVNSAQPEKPKEPDRPLIPEDPKFKAAKERVKQRYAQEEEDERGELFNRFRKSLRSMEENKVKAYSGIFLLEVKDLASDYFNRANRTKWSLRFLMKKPDELPIKTFPKNKTKNLPPPKKPKELGYKG